MGFFPDDWLDSPIPDSVEKRQNLITALIPAFVEGGYSLTSARNSLRDAGFSFGNTYFSEAWYSVESGFTAGQAITLLHDDTIIPNAIFGSWTVGPPLEDKYTFITRYAWTDEETGKTMHGTFRFNESSISDKNELYGKIYQYMENLYPHQFDNLEWVDIDRAYLNPDFF